MTAYDCRMKNEQTIGKTEAPFAFRPSKGYRERLEALAKFDDRSVAWEINNAIRVWLGLREKFPHEKASE